MLFSIRFARLLPLFLLASAASSSLKAQEPPTKAFEVRDVPLTMIFDEWRRKGNNANTYICACDQDICDTRPGWPFRVFRTGQSIPVLGEYNLAGARRNGFVCGRR